MEKLEDMDESPMEKLEDMEDDLIYSLRPTTKRKLFVVLIGFVLLMVVYHMVFNRNMLNDTDTVVDGTLTGINQIASEATNTMNGAGQDILGNVTAEAARMFS
jgi:hypothetical protein